MAAEDLLRGAYAKVERAEKHMAELRKTQQERIQQERRDLDVAAKLYLAAQHDRKPFRPADHGFDFSLSDIHNYLDGMRAANIARRKLQTDLDGSETLREAA